jgi:hypothetical protein
MHLSINGHLRGEAIHIEWTEGSVTGDLELVERARNLHRRLHRRPFDETDPVAFITALERVSPEHLDVHLAAEEDSRPESALW